MGFYYFDYTYFIFIVPALLLSLGAQIMVKSTFQKYSGTVERCVRTRRRRGRPAIWFCAGRGYSSNCGKPDGSF